MAREGLMGGVASYKTLGRPDQIYLGGLAVALLCGILFDVITIQVKAPDLPAGLAGLIPNSAASVSAFDMGAKAKKEGQLRRFIRPESIQKFKASIKPLTKRANGHSLEAIAKRLQPKLAGFYGYFKQASATTLSGGSGSGPRKAPRFNFS